MSELRRSPSGRSEDTPLRVVHLISGLDLGGAETMLFRLISTLDREYFLCHVVSMTTEGEFGPRLRRLGIPVSTLNMPRGVPVPTALLKLVRLLRREAPDIIQSWMYHADLMGGLAAQVAGGIPVVWGVRHSDLRPTSARWLTRLTARVNARLSSWVPERIVYVSETGRRLHEALGYDTLRGVVIPNGIDVQEFRPDPDSRRRTRDDLALPADALLVGHVARFHPQKDHRTFLAAAALVQERVAGVHFILAGEAITQDNTMLWGWVTEYGLQHAVHLVGKHGDPRNLFAAMDVFCLSSSSGEACPQVVLEAMACGVPCVVTDVGDAVAMVGPTGRVVPPGNAKALADALVEVLGMPAEVRARLGELGRERVRLHYRLEKTVGKYAELYRVVARAR